MKGYSSKVTDSSRELTKKETVMLKDVTSCESLDEASKNTDLLIEVDAWAVLEIHNEKVRDGGNKDYEKFVIIDKNGAKFATSSQAFWSTFMDVWSDMQGEADWMLKVIRKPSKNFSGKEFLSCTVI